MKLIDAYFRRMWDGLAKNLDLEVSLGGVKL